ncbi:glycosyltransferase family 2 protein [Knoellia sp. p5-6-4]|uniref:glycosyltransferase family 2 protein n=1 Tax=unclassified Knoellia TaxID=2618719 RepID=UPI0023DCC52D|nr:glycosyltransferase family 2 protein [Knoellia sp. p5-6-4]MDF2144139.1 glycosyltransferase family 2 protein [Knoellia sp. p5-6-4]
MASTPHGEPLVDVVIPVHSDARPLERAIRSVVDGGLPLAPHSGGVRITVVCHNVAPERIRASISPPYRDLARLLELHDPHRSPAGPRNHGLRSSTATYVSFLDSDDYFQPGALARWVAVAERHGSDFVIPRVEDDRGHALRSPLPRFLRKRKVDGLKDRLFYRTVMFGLHRREFTRAKQLSFNCNVVTGEDLEFGLRIYFSDARIDCVPTAPGYVLSDDATDRVRAAPRPVREDLQACCSLVANPWFRRLSESERTAIVVKLIRVHVLGAVSDRRASDLWTGEERRDLSCVSSEILGAAPHARHYLSVAEDRLLSWALDASATDDGIRRSDLSQHSVLHLRWDLLVAASPRCSLSRDAPLRMFLAKALVR